MLDDRFLYWTFISVLLLEYEDFVDGDFNKNKVVCPVTRVFCFSFPSEITLPDSPCHKFNQQLVIRKHHIALIMHNRALKTLVSVLKTTYCFRLVSSRNTEKIIKIKFPYSNVS